MRITIEDLMMLLILIGVGIVIVEVSILIIIALPIVASLITNIPAEVVIIVAIGSAGGFCAWFYVMWTTRINKPKVDG